MKKNVLYQILLMMIFCSCSIKHNLYLTRVKLPDNKVGNIIVSIDSKNLASVSIIRRESEIVKDAYTLNRKSRMQYESREMTLILTSKMANIQWRDENFTAHKVKRKTKKTTLIKIESMISENYFIWANEHQITEHDMKEDSLCYIYRKPEKKPYDTKRWFLLSIADEYFLTFNDASNSIPRIQIKKGKMFETHCQESGCKEYEVTLEKKENDRQQDAKRQ